MTVELSDGEAREVAEILRRNERHLIAEFATEDVDVDDTDGGEWANRLEDRIGGANVDATDKRYECTECLWKSDVAGNADFHADATGHAVVDTQGDAKDKTDNGKVESGKE